MDLPERFVDHVLSRRLLAPGERVLLACSGGADSVALARLLSAAAGRLGLAGVALAHLDHGLRDGSPADARFVEGLGAELGLAVHVERRTVERAPGKSPEEAARHVRLAFLSTVAEREGMDVVAVGHHLDDQAETVLMRVLTGCGLDGLAAMHAERRLRGPEGTGAIRLIRPLLAFRRAELVTYLRSVEQAWREDPTNVDGNLRARLRHRALPLLCETVARDVAPLLARLADNAQDVAGMQDGRAAGAAFVELRGGAALLHCGFERLHDADLASPLREVVSRLRGAERPATRAEVDRLIRIARGDTAETVSGLRVDAARAGAVRISRTCASPPSEPCAAPPALQSLPVPGEVLLAGRGLRIAADSGPLCARRVIQRLAARSGHSELLDAGAIAGPLVVRDLQPGDRFVPLGGTASARATHCLQRRGVPAADRGRVPVVADEEGIVWLAGHALADRVKLRADTTEVVALSFERVSDHGDSRYED